MNLRLFLSLWVLASSAPALAQLDNISPGELALTSEYCPDTQTFAGKYTTGAVAERQRKWVSMMGETFWTMHHYCWAQVAWIRATQAGVSPQTRDGLLRGAISDIYYVINHAPADYVLMPELLTRIGEYYTRIGNASQASAHFQRAIDAKADYWPPYVRLADIYLQLGERTKALEIIDAGLRHVPGNAQLTESRSRITARGAKSN